MCECRKGGCLFAHEFVCILLFQQKCSRKNSSIPGFPCKVQYWIQRERGFSLQVKLLLPSQIIFWSSSQLCHFVSGDGFHVKLPLCVPFCYIFISFYVFFFSIKLYFTLFTLFWVRRPLLFCLLQNCQTIPKDCFHFLYLYKTTLLGLAAVTLSCLFVVSRDFPIQTVSDLSLLLKCTIN